MHDYSNLILLCPTDHKRVDARHSEFTTAKLLEIKADHERWVDDALEFRAQTSTSVWKALHDEVGDASLNNSDQDRGHPLDALGYWVHATAKYVAADDLLLYCRARDGRPSMAWAYFHGEVRLAFSDSPAFHTGFEAFSDAEVIEDRPEVPLPTDKPLPTNADGTCRDDYFDAVERQIRMLGSSLDAELVLYFRSRDGKSPELAFRFRAGRVEAAGGRYRCFARAFKAFPRMQAFDVSERVRDLILDCDQRRAEDGDDDIHHEGMAKLFALAVRNGVEDLHSTGAFSDAQAPTFNRLVRNRFFEALLVLEAARDADPESPLMKWAAERFDTEAPDGLSAVLPDACVDAISEFGETFELDGDVVDELIEDALESLGDAIDRFKRQEVETFSLLLASIPLYWEEPQASTDLLERLKLTSKVD